MWLCRNGSDGFDLPVLKLTVPDTATADEDDNDDDLLDDEDATSIFPPGTNFIHARNGTH